MFSDQHVIPAGFAVFRQDQPGHFAQAAFGAVARDGVADLLGTGESDAGGRIVIVARAGLHHHARRALTAGAGGGEEIGAFGQGDKLCT